MARRHRRGFGRLKGTGMVRDVLPPVLGFGVALLSTLGIRAAIEVTDTGTQKVYRFAPLIGGLLGAIVGGASMHLLGGKGQGISSAAVAVLTGVGLFGSERLNAGKAGSAIALAPSAASQTLPPTGTGALVAQRERQLRGAGGMGTILLEQTRGTAGVGSMGEQVNLGGVVNTNAFGRGLNN